MAQWAIMGSHIAELRLQLAALRTDVETSERLLGLHENRLSILETRYEYIREIVAELRRQANVQAP